jgi:FkbM family methyltransferase
VLGEEALPAELAGARRVLVSCDVRDEAAIATVLSEILPLLGDRENLVVVAGIADARLIEVDRSYAAAQHWQGHLVSASAELVTLYDFLSRNHVAFTTTPESVLFSVEQGFEYPLSAARRPPAFLAFRPWEGTVDPGWLVNWIGARTRTSVQTELRGYTAPTFQRGEYPAVSEELFEWLDVLESVLEAGELFTMVELGAGWGRWLVNAAVALRQLDPERPTRLVGVEAEPTHYKWLRRHLLDNSIDPKQHRLIRAAVAERDGWVSFQRGDAADWYGQAIERGDPAAKLAGPASRLIRWSRNTAANRTAFGHSARKVRRSRAVSLARILAPLDRVDLIHVDVQGAEAAVLEAAAAELDAKVARVHVGTHDEENEERLRTLFATLGWECRFDFPGRSQSLTPWGPVAFQDGVQSWKNPQRAATTSSDEISTSDATEPRLST